MHLQQCIILLKDLALHQHPAMSGCGSTSPHQTAMALVVLVVVLLLLGFVSCGRTPSTAIAGTAAGGTANGFAAVGAYGIWVVIH
jgi:hypothetical protein